MDVQTLRVFERWHKMSAKRWWRMIPASYVASVHHEVSRKVADHLTTLRTRAERERKCETCRHCYFRDGEVLCELGGDVIFGDNTLNCRADDMLCGPSGKLWTWKEGK